jgi:hypothetical protein
MYASPMNLLLNFTALSFGRLASVVSRARDFRTLVHSDIAGYRLQLLGNF